MLQVPKPSGTGSGTDNGQDEAETRSASGCIERTAFAGHPERKIWKHHRLRCATSDACGVMDNPF